MDARGKHGQTPLHLAAAKGHEESIRVLLDADADIDARDLQGWTALHQASRKSSLR